MIVVSDTSPLCYLVLIGKVEVLSAMYRCVVIPNAVHDELSSDKAPLAVKEWISKPPEWLVTRTVSFELEQAMQNIDRGEQEAIMLATTLSADLILMDDLAGRRAARRKGHTVIGLLGILKMASDGGLLNLRDSVDSLRLTNFRIADHLLEQLLAESEKKK